MPKTPPSDLRKALNEITQDFDLVPKTGDIVQSEYRYRRLMVEMLEKLLEEQRRKLRALEMGLVKDRGMDSTDVQTSGRLDGFPHDSPRIDRAIYFIKREGRPLQLRELTDCFAEVDAMAKHNPKDYRQSLSVDMSQGIKRGRIKRYSLPRKRGGWYFPNSWADENGELLTEYQKMID